jgi:hypothetical protein
MSAVAAELLVARRLAHETKGVNAMLAELPMDTSDGDRPAPADVTIYNEIEDNWVARGTVPRKKTGNGPLVLVRRAPTEQESVSLGMAEVDSADQPHIGVLIEHIERKENAGDDTDGVASGARDSIDTMRCCERCLHVWFAETTPAEREFAGARVLDGGPVVHVPLQTKLGSDYCSAGLVLTLRTTDRWATNISDS